MGRGCRRWAGQGVLLLLRDARASCKSLIGDVPDKSGVKLFLERYLEGRTVTEISQELGVTREWVSRAYRKEALALAGKQFVRLVSREDNPTE